MDWVGYVATLEARVEGMRLNRRYHVLFDLYGGTHPDTPWQVEHDLHTAPDQEHVRIPNELRAFYLTTMGFDLSWSLMTEGALRWQRVRRGDQEVIVSYGAPSGTAHIGMLARLYIPLLDEGPGRHAIPDTALYASYRTLDSLSNGDRVTVRFYPDRQEPVLFYHRHDTDRYHPLALDFAAYMELLLEARALKGWQQFFIADPSYEVEAAWMEWFHANLTRLFPDADASRFQRVPT